MQCVTGVKLVEVVMFYDLDTIYSIGLRNHGGGCDSAYFRRLKMGQYIPFERRIDGACIGQAFIICW